MERIKKKVLFFLPYLRVGGIERAFIALYKALQFSGCNVDICLNLPGGNFEQLLPADTSYILPYQTTEREYDIAVSFAQSLLPKVWAPFVQAKKKIQWLHANFAYESLDGVVEASDLIDHFIVVSEEALHNFTVRFPQLASRAECIYNCVDTQAIVAAADEAVPDPLPKDAIANILSVVRLSPIKAVDRSVRVLHRLLQAHIPCRWFIIGDGIERYVLEQHIASLGLQHSFFLLGERLNPFPYMRAADIVACCSLSESFNMSLCEAKVLQKPILTTCVPGAKEQITSSVTGLIVDNTEQAIFEGLRHLLIHPEERLRYAQVQHDFSVHNNNALLRLQHLFQ